MVREVSGRVAFITGGASGIGLGIAKAFCAAGMKVAITYRTEEHLDAALEELRGQRGAIVHPMRLDVTDRSAVRAAADEVERVFGEVHVLCNNAGVNLLGPMEEATYDDWDWILGVNVGGVINVLVEFLPKLLSHGKGGHVLNVASMASFIGGPRYGVYAASKFAVRGLTESLRYNLARYGIGVSLLCPGLTQSRIYEAPLRRPERFSNSGVKVDDAVVQRLAAVHALGMDADEVGRRALRGILRNDFYIFSHPEFREEVGELNEEVLQAFPDEEPDPRRMPYERMRIQNKDEAKRLIDAL
jgi:NAD(P)-dependent dehydrogenase (short-subunit alcohol dehydrogenase family)